MGFLIRDARDIARIGNSSADVKVKIKRNNRFCLIFRAGSDGRGFKCLFYLCCGFCPSLFFHVVVVVFGFRMTDLSEKLVGFSSLVVFH